MSYFCSEQNSLEGGRATRWPFFFAYIAKFEMTLRRAASHSVCVLNPHSDSAFSPKSYPQLGQSLGTVFPFTNDKHQTTSASTAASRVLIVLLASDSLDEGDYMPPTSFLTSVLSPLPEECEL